MVVHESWASPVSKLHDDILWSIFQFNSYPTAHTQEDGPEEIFSFLHRTGNPELDPPLLTNRRTSQVCRQWRKVMIHSPSIWARAIELQYLNQSGDAWRREVLIRTGDAPLTVIGRIGEDAADAFSSTTAGHNMQTMTFTLNLLDTHWDRIQNLIILSYDATIDQQLCAALHRAAPNLEKFIVALDQNRVGNEVTPFVNHSPRLHTLSTHGLSFTLSEPSWSSNIRHLNIAWSTQDMSIPELLHGLKNMSSLETLSLCDITKDSYKVAVRQLNSEIPITTFSGLRKFSIHDSDSAIPDIVSHVIIPPHCNFKIDCSIDDFNIEVEVPAHIQGLCYTTFFKNNIPHSNITDVTYMLQYTNSRDTSEDGFEDGQPDDMYMLEISINDPIASSRKRNPRFSYTASLVGVSNTLFRMAEALSSCDLRNVTTFTLSLQVHYCDSILKHPLFEQLYDLLLALESVETLHTDEETLRFYMESEDLCVTNVLFPRLVTVYTDCWDNGLIRFLNYRHNNANQDPVGDDGGGGVKHLERVVFTKAPPISFVDQLVAGMASIFGVSVEWQGYIAQ